MNFFKFAFMVALSLNSFANLFAQSSKEMVGVLADSEDQVWVDGKKVEAGAPIKASSTIETKDGKASLLLGRGTVVHLDEKTKLSIQKFKKTPNLEEMALQMKFGRLRALVATKGKKELRTFEVKTRTGTMGVRGTHILIESPADQTSPETFLTLEGEAMVVLDQVDSRVPTAPIVLLQNQSLRSDQAETKEISISDAKERAESIAPPAATPKDSEQMDAVLESKAIDEAEPLEGISFDLPEALTDPSAEGEIPRDPAFDPSTPLPLEIKFTP